MIGKRKNLKYKGVRVNFLGIPISPKNRPIPKRQYLRSFGSHSSNTTTHGPVTGKSAVPRHSRPKNLLLMYDIPDTRKKERDWFRRQLKAFDFVMIQKSVWVGPAPLPVNFLDYVKEISLEKQFRMIKLAKAYSPAPSTRIRI